MVLRAGSGSLRTAGLGGKPTYGVVRKSRKTHNGRLLFPACSFSPCSPVRSSCARGVGGAPWT